MKNDIRQVEVIDADFGFRSPGKERMLLKKINLQMNEGELVALIGKNGSGKTTFLRTMMRLHPLAGGKISFSGRELHTFSRNEFARLTAFVSTEIIRNDQMRLRDLVELGRFPYTNWLGKADKEDLKAVEKAIQAAGLGRLQNARISELSDGERQRAMIARILAQNSVFLLLDEPTAFLDIPNKYEIISLLRSLSRNGKMILFSTHDLHLALQFCDKVWLIEQEHIVEGAPEDLIINGSLARIFNSEKVNFNSSNAGFEPVNPEKGKIHISAGGDAFVRQWTISAVRRAGYRIVKEHERNIFSVKIISEKNTYVWKLHSGNESLLFRNLYELNSYLTNT